MMAFDPIPPPRKFSGGWTIEDALAKTGFHATTSPVSFFSLAGRLKKLQRQGWKRFGIDPESVADHSHRMTFMALLAPQSLDQAKVVKMCLVHDLAETVVGDITPADGVSREEKTHREEAAMHWMTTHWGDFGREVHHLWIEFEAGLTPEGEFAQDLDKLEMMLQALEYERDADLAVDLGEFFAVAGRIRTPRAQAWTAEVLRDRELLWAGKEHVRGDLGVEGGLLQKKQEEQDLYYNQ
ncbi:HD domain-containing protein [Verticillium alfalfae VaMs.102]|uniref:5'-deoxynucleotidase n=1 Tax=Verticillium alfalfae (strain VaMs.102 / ATCC MYA-4576 / FGSC 10136) TaxID=526221 RepID=C9SBP8_VERA1|nr:HD domain-containing protein [Verticillium alfalfae VaMs.102]EEY15782.1 HD domain-containing protein [Verticillium alfalfae VaMs.102]